jgi:predicted XRE-type DNA-binding protein
MKRELIILTSEQRQALEQFTKTGVRSVRLINRAKIMLALDASEGRKATTQEEIAKSLGISRNTVNVARRDFIAAESVERFLQRKKRETPPRKIKVTGDVEAHIIAIACSKAPEGHARWSVHLIADKCIELNLVGSLSHMSVHRVLKKHRLSLT